MLNRRLFPLLYWFGLLLALVGVALRFWLAWQRPGLALVIAGVVLVLAARFLARAGKHN